MCRYFGPAGSGSLQSKNILGRPNYQEDKLQRQLY
jgi:hypothetical protein